MFGDGTDPIGMPITVTGSKPLTPPPVTGPVEAATPAGTPVAPAPTKKKHIWQDVLGAVGDAMLAQGGSKPMYAPKRQEFLVGEAMQGFDKDPVGTIKAVSKLDPALGERMLNNYQENEIRKDAQAYADMRAKRDDDLARQQYEDKTFDVAFSMLGNPNIEKSYTKVRLQILKYLEARGIDPEKAGLPETYDREAIDSLYRTTKASMADEKLASLNAYRDGVLDIRRERLGQTGANTASQIADRSADNTRADAALGETVTHHRNSEAISASKGKAGRRPSPTVAPATKKYDDNKMYTNAAGVTKSGKELNAMAQ